MPVLSLFIIVLGDDSNNYTFCAVVITLKVLVFPNDVSTMSTCRTLQQSINTDCLFYSAKRNVLMCGDFLSWLECFISLLYFEICLRLIFKLFCI